MLERRQWCQGGGWQTSILEGDRGGALVMEDKENYKSMTLVGVVSAGSTFADKNYPWLYTDVKKYCTDGWLQEQISGVKLCSHPPSTDLQHTPVTTEHTTPTTTTIITTEADKENQEKAAAEDLTVILIGGDGIHSGRRLRCGPLHPPVTSNSLTCLTTAPPIAALVLKGFL